MWRGILEVLAAVASVRVVPEVVAYAVRLTRATREAQGLAMGAGTRGAISLVRGGQIVRGAGGPRLCHAR